MRDKNKTVVPGSALTGKMQLILLLLVFSSFSQARAAETDTAVNRLEVAGTADITPDVVAYDDYHDPLEAMNRKVFAFNDKLYLHALIPAASAYVAGVPQPVRKGIANVFSNLKEPLYFINHALQGKGGKSGTSLLRFLTNTTLGIAGIFDPAQHWFGLERQQSSLAQSLQRFGMGEGPFLVLPVFGMSTLRNGSAALVESAFNPIRAVSDNPETLYLISLDNFQRIAPGAERYEELRTASADPYLYFRNQYLQGQQRDAEFPQPEAKDSP